MNDLFAQVECAKREWEVTVDAIGDSIALIETNDLTIVRSNWTLATIFETIPHHLVGKNIHTLLCGCTDAQCPILALMKSPQSNCLEIKLPNNHQCWILSVYPIPDNNPMPARNVIYLRDVTQERARQQQIIEAEKQASMILVAASIAQKIAPNVSYIEHSLFSISKDLVCLRSAFIDYRLALKMHPQKNSSVEWEDIEARHGVEFLLQNVEGLLRQSTRDLNQVWGVIDNLCNLDQRNNHLQFNDLQHILENALETVWKMTNSKTVIERKYESLPPVRCNLLQLQTAFVLLLLTLIDVFDNPVTILIQTQTTANIVKMTFGTLVKDPPNISVVPHHEPLNADNDQNIHNMSIMPVFGIIQDHGGEIHFKNDEVVAFAISVTLPINGPG